MIRAVITSPGYVDNSLIEYQKNGWDYQSMISVDTSIVLIFDDGQTDSTPIEKDQNSQKESPNSAILEDSQPMMSEEQFEDEYFAVRQEHLDAQARVKVTHKNEIQAHKDYLQKLKGYDL